MEVNEKEILQKHFEEDESECLDYKREYHKDKAELLRDILCLSNADTNKDRRIIFGVSDNRRDFPGISKDPNRKKQREIVVFLRDVSLNRMPDVEIDTIMLCNREFDILTIFNQPCKPYFLTKPIFKV